MLEILKNVNDFNIFVRDNFSDISYEGMEELSYNYPKEYPAIPIITKRTVIYLYKKDIRELSSGMGIQNDK